ncbi:MAG: Asp-tRNA(Asn)/Glu-tRNA(Gln) amidotransferase subunit GatC [Cyclobacteriaceae bacterium]|jgi:aspartyl-tRNA(Asn)/glutamyl-tRNA(Gln) amidotransferase subunit C
MNIDRDTLHKLAHLARLQINPADESQMLSDLSRIVSFVEKLKEVDTTGVEPLTSMAQEVNTWRTDEVQPHLDRHTALQQAPAQDGTFFTVPKVID